LVGIQGSCGRKFFFINSLNFDLRTLFESSWRFSTRDLSSRFLGRRYGTVVICESLLINQDSLRCYDGAVDPFFYLCLARRRLLVLQLPSRSTTMNTSASRCCSLPSPTVRPLGSMSWGRGTGLEQTTIEPSKQHLPPF
jgi:hypothetical protein